MKICLINTPYKDIYGPIKSGVGLYFPIGLGYIASVLLKKGHKVTILDPEAENLNYEEIKSFLKKSSPDIISISCATPNFMNASNIAKMIKKELNMPVIIGGIHVSALPERTIKNHPEFDIAVIGEGENSFSEICDYYENKCKNIKDIDGIVYRTKSGIKKTKPRKLIENVDTLPFPARQLVDINKYKLSVHVDLGKKSATILTSRGCPFQCTYCASYLTMGYRFRFHSDKYVISEIEHLKSKYSISHIVMQDDTFTVNKKRVEKICNALIDKKLDIRWYCFARVDTVTKEMLALMKKSGCYSIGYGIESADDIILKNIKKNITIEQCRKALKSSNEVGLRTLAFFMFGNPGETRESIEKTIKFARELKPDLAFFNTLIPYPGTEIYDTYYKTKFEGSENWKDFVAIGVNPVIEFKDISTKDLQKYVYKANIQFYLRPLHILHLASQLRSFNELKVYINGGYSILKQCFSWKKKSKN